MKKTIIVVNNIKALATNENGQARHSLSNGGRGKDDFCVVVLRDGETLESLGIKTGVSVTAEPRDAVNRDGVPYTALYFTSITDTNADLKKDYEYQLQLAKTKGLAQAQAMSNPALKALFDDRQGVPPSVATA